MSQAPIAVSPPPLHIPPSDNTVKLSIIDTTSRIKGPPTNVFFEPVIKGFEVMDCPAYAFLIEHEQSSSKLVFDLGVSKDWRNGRGLAKQALKLGWEISVPKAVSDILTEHGVPLETISTVIWSHWHWDHTGDPNFFPPTTSLTVGPGFKSAMLPGYPTNPESPILESAYKGRELVEISFDHTSELRIGGFRAFDYFGDGSFYLLDSPGHAIGHLCGLARTTPDTFVFLGADICHHGGQMRPTKYLPFPESISPNPFPHQLKASACPGELLLNVHPNHSATEPFYHVADPPQGGAASTDPAEAQKSVEKLIDIDCHENIFTVIAHDQTILDIVEFFPKTLNEWKSKGYREKSMWKFLKDFKGALA